MRPLLVVIAWFCLLVTAGAQTGGSGKEKMPAPFQPPHQEEVTSGSCPQQDAETAKICQEMLRESYRYTIAAYQHRRESFNWSLTASKIIFVLVLALVASGIVFAAIQFSAALLEARSGRGHKAASGGHDKKSATSMDTDLELSPQGIKASSSVLGVIVLLISMAFFYLYAQFVYPIHEITHDGPDVAQGTK
jgi:hypothetical protein